MRMYAVLNVIVIVRTVTMNTLQIRFGVSEPVRYNAVDERNNNKKKIKNPKIN